MKMVILCGLPGSGKTTLAHALQARRDSVLVAADDFFEDRGGFDPRLLSEAHRQCFRRVVEKCILKSTELLVVHNTNTQNWERSPYVLLAQASEIPHLVVTLEGLPETVGPRSVHDVPQASVTAMHARWERPLPFWPTLALPQCAKAEIDEKWVSPILVRLFE